MKQEHYISPECCLVEMTPTQITCASVVSESFMDEFETVNW